MFQAAAKEGRQRKDSQRQRGQKTAVEESAAKDQETAVEKSAAEAQETAAKEALAKDQETAVLNSGK